MSEARCWFVANGGQTESRQVVADGGAAHSFSSCHVASSACLGNHTPWGYGSRVNLNQDRSACLPRPAGRNLADRPVDPTALMAIVERVDEPARPVGGVKGADGDPNLIADTVVVTFHRNLARHGIVETQRALILEAA